MARNRQYLILLDCGVGEVIKIKLTPAEIRKSRKYDDFEDFIRAELEGKYDFNLSYCSWMVIEDEYYERTYNF